MSIPPPESTLVSREYRVLPPDPKNEKIATKNTTTPKPPIQCDRHRQNIRLRGKREKSPKTEEPVVVRPLADSKNASQNGASRIITYGRVPSSDARVQPTPTMHIASFLKSLPDAVRLGRKNENASNAENATAEIHDGSASPSSGETAL